MWRVVAVFRIITLAYASFLIFRNHDQYAHPGGGFVALAVMAGWTILTVVAFARPAGRLPWLVVADVAVSVVLVLSTRWIDTGVRITNGAPTIPSTWAVAAVLSCAVAGGPWAGAGGRRRGLGRGSGRTAGVPAAGHL